jgi:hypothetical protein
MILESPPPPLLNKIGLSYRMGINISVDFHNLGGLQLSDPGSLLGSTVNRNYDNGYNRVDVSGNAGGLTWYWGYTSPQSAQGGNLALQSDSTPATATTGSYQHHPQSGAELSYEREFKRAKHWRLGAEAAFGYEAVSISANDTLSYFVNRTSDTYPLNGIIPPQAPYFGTFEGPGPLIPSMPSGRTTTVLPASATIIGDRKIDSDVFTLRLGPYFEVPLSRKFLVALYGGLTLAVADTQFTFSETVIISDPLYNINLVSTPRSGSGSQTDFLVGGYGGANLSYLISDRVSLFGGAMYQAAGEAINHQSGKESVLNLGKSVIFTIGAKYSF